MKNFHLPLPADTYEALRAEATRSRVPATALAREAITSWLRARKRVARNNAIREYADAMTGTEFDLDPVLEAAAVEESLRMDPE